MQSPGNGLHAGVHYMELHRRLLMIRRGAANRIAWKAMSPIGYPYMVDACLGGPLGLPLSIEDNGGW